MIYLISALMFNVAFAQATPSPTPVTGVKGDPVKAYELARQTNWSVARIEAENATKSHPTDARAWFMLGVCEERLENLNGAVTAFEKYLSLSADTPAAKAVREKMPELKGRANTMAQETYGTSSNGFFIEKSLSYDAAYVDEIHGQAGTPFGVGFNFGKAYWGYRQFTGTFKEDLKVPDDSDPPVYSAAAGGGDFTTREIFVNINFSMIDPYTTWGNLQLAVPLFMGFGTNTLKVDSTGKFYGNWTYDAGLGLALRGFTRSSFTWYVQGIYHLGVPFWKFKAWGDDDPIKNAANEEIKGSLTGFDTTVGVSFLFGDKPKKHY